MGQKLAAYNTSGAITAFYDTVDSPAPAGVTTIDITDTQWQTCLSNSGYTVVSGVLTPPSPPTPTQLAATAAQAQTAAMQTACQNATNTPVSFKNAAGVTSTYAFGNTMTSGGANAQALLIQIIGAGSAAWTAGAWKDTNGIYQAMTFADLQGLAAAIEAMDTPDEQTLIAKEASIQAIQNLPARVASTAYTASQQIVDTNGNVWTASAGTTGTTCTFPTSPAIGATKTDGSVTWTFAGSQVALIEGVTW